MFEIQKLIKKIVIVDFRFFKSLLEVTKCTECARPSSRKTQNYRSKKTMDSERTPKYLKCYSELTFFVYVETDTLRWKL